MALHSATTAEVDAEHGQRLDNFLLGRLKHLPKSRIYRMVRRGEVRVNGGRARPGYRLQRGDQVRIPPHRRADDDQRLSAPLPRGAAEALRRRVLYQDDDVLVLDKPCGIAVHGGSGIAYGIIETLRHTPGIAPPSCRLELAHRLDRDTSGCLVVAKNRPALLRLHDQFRAGRVRKRYDLIVAGRWPASTRTVTEPLARYVLANGERRMRVAADGDPARTDFAVVAHLDGASWLAAHPKTGRTHQIRVHAAACGHPILGDDKYARGEAQAHGRLMLHASELKLTLGDRQIRFRAPLPQEFDQYPRA